MFGPQDDSKKVQFMQELREIRATCQGPWLLMGDFNLIYKVEDKNTGNINRALMGRFLGLINDLGLKELFYMGGNSHGQISNIHLLWLS